MSGMDFERTFFELIERIREEKGLSKRSLSDKAFTSQSKEDNKYQRIEKTSKKTGKPQRISLEDAYDLAKSVGYHLPELIWLTWKEHKD